jgi:hypothetical protein
LVIENKDVEFVLSHFEPPAFPRRISTFGSNCKQYVCESMDQCLEDFALSKWIDCRINAYNYLGEWDQNPQQLGRGFTTQNSDRTRDPTSAACVDPSFIMIDIDRKEFPSEKTFQRALRATQRKIQDAFLLDKDTNPCTIVATGGGAHLLIPLECDPAKFDAPQLYHKENLLQGYNPNDFIRFCARFFAKDVDKGFYPSTNSTMVRIPGGINSKYKGDNAIVKILSKWDGKTKGHILCLLGEFHRHILREQKERQQRRAVVSTAPATLDRSGAPDANEAQRYWYVQELLSIGIGDFRKRAICLLLAPWCINIQKMDHDTAERALLDWVDRCQVVKPLEFDAYKIINQALVYAESRQYYPLGLFKLKEQEPELYHRLMQAAECSLAATRVRLQGRGGK